MDQQLTELDVTEKLVDYFPNQTTQCFKPHCKPNKQMFEYLSIANLQPIDSQELSDCENDTRSKVSDPLEFPYSAIGFLSLKYGLKRYRASGFLVGPNIVLTAARNLYIHSLQKECEQVKFYPGLHSLTGREYDVKKFYYPRQYKSSTPDKRGEYDFAILELYEDIGLKYGYFGVDFRDNKQQFLSESAHVYGYPGYVYQNKKKIDARHCIYGGQGKWLKESENRIKYKISTSEGQCGSPIYLKGAYDSYTAVGIHSDCNITSNSGLMLNTKIKARINEWINKLQKQVKLKNDDKMQDNDQRRISQKEFKAIIKKIQQKQINKVNLIKNNIGFQEAKLLGQTNWPSLTGINLTDNYIGAQEAKFLSQANWPSLTTIGLGSNHIEAQGAKFLSQADWPSLTSIDLRCNNIRSQGAKFLSQANWPSLTVVSLWSNNIGTQGAKFLSQANWPLLTSISLFYNNIGTQGAKFLSQANWPLLTSISLCNTDYLFREQQHSSVRSEVSLDIYNKFLSQANWPWLAVISLWDDKIQAQGARFFSQAYWPLLTEIYLDNNEIGTEGAKFLSQVNWPSLMSIYLRSNSFGAYETNFIKFIQWFAHPNFRIWL